MRMTRHLTRLWLLVTRSRRSLRPLTLIYAFNVTVNRAQKGLLDVIGTPAQANILEEVKRSQESLADKVGLMQQVTYFSFRSRSSRVSS